MEEDGESPPSEADTTTDGSAAVPDAIRDLGRWDVVPAAGIVVVILAAVVLGIGPIGGATDADTAAGGTATATPAPTASAAGAATTTTAGAPAITMQVRSIESCGRRCREVTVTLSNEGAVAARDVRVSTTMTTGGSLIWQGSSDIGRIPAGETVTRTRTIEVGYVDAARIKANDGIVRIETTVRSASGTQTFTERRDVA